MTTTETHHSWRHGWIPLTMSAALAKAHGDHKRAAKLLGAAREHRAVKREAAARSFVTPHPNHQTEHAAASAAAQKRAAAARRRKVWQQAINTPPPSGRRASTARPGAQSSRAQAAHTAVAKAAKAPVRPTGYGAWRVIEYSKAKNRPGPMGSEKFASEKDARAWAAEQRTTYPGARYVVSRAGQGHARWVD